MCRLIGIVGPAGHGKTTIGGLLKMKGYTHVRMADPLKDALMALGLTKEQVDGRLKETPTDILCGKTPRYAMQTLGTEWARKTIGEDFWVRTMQNRLVHMWCDNPDTQVVIDDIRFPNEVDMILGNGGEIWRVVDPRKMEPVSRWERFMRSIGWGKTHPSELYWERIVPHSDIVNDGKMSDLREKVERALFDCEQRERREHGGKTIREYVRATPPFSLPQLMQQAMAQ